MHSYLKNLLIIRCPANSTNERCARGPWQSAADRKMQPLSASPWKSDLLPNRCYTRERRRRPAKSCSAGGVLRGRRTPAPLSRHRWRDVKTPKTDNDPPQKGEMVEKRHFSAELDKKHRTVLPQDAAERTLPPQLNSAPCSVCPSDSGDIGAKASMPSPRTM